MLTNGSRLAAFCGQFMQTDFGMRAGSGENYTSPISEMADLGVHQEDN